MPVSNKTKYLFIVNDSPYGNERPYNAFRLALNLLKRDECEVSVFLMGDGVNCAIAQQQTPDGYYNIARMLKSLARRGKVATCGTCVETRGLDPKSFVPGVEKGTISMAGEWSIAADKVLVF